MNDFARLRHELYVDRSTDDIRKDPIALERLADALLGQSLPEDAIRAVVSAVCQRYGVKPTSPPSSPASPVVEPYVTRYLKDASAVASVTASDPSNGGEAIAHPVSVVQCMFYGDPQRAGRGNSGGIATLLMELGDMMSAEVGGVVTLVLYNTLTAGYPLVPIERVSDGHSIVRVPVALEEESAHGFLLARDQIKEAIAASLREFAIDPEVVHVRFLDDASFAAAQIARERGAKLVVTLTPDPHRTVCENNGQVRDMPGPEALEVFNKVLLGDDLVFMADGVLAIGQHTVSRELLQYYPQLEDTRRRVVAGIDEGVRVQPGVPDTDVAELLTGDSATLRLDPLRVHLPSLISVGRLAPVKQQVDLVHAWARDAWRTHNLILVGGDHGRPSAPEKRILDEIAGVLDSRPELAGSVCLLPAQPNPVVRKLHEHFASRQEDGEFNAYVCPSMKEEFGLSVVEAMASGMMVCAPVRGGARSYIRHGINGFLVDTSDADALSEELTGTVLSRNLVPEQVAAIRRNAATTVAERYSMDAVAGKFVEFYREVLNA